MEKIIEVKNKYICKKCNKFIASFKEDGYIEINPKSKKISTNGSEFKITCQCGEVHRIKI
ncbi:hypothetical protein SAMN02745174_02268 [Cetobacterium ceti]|uniref:Uncharacterized protein n=1 Tax=Cetobacterium ceti TaxID=180163 RepID=A0A1T4QC40_9FUSO|nr:hypothetical protein [Cetobacterium ceti]SKA01360.1 hypothetical protein SAMN02745174_02268 [Cetobacterium ceti]